MKGLNMALLLKQLKKMEEDHSFLDFLPSSINKYCKQVNRETVKELKHLFTQQQHLINKDNHMISKEECDHYERSWVFAQHKLFCLLKFWLEHQQELPKELLRLTKSQHCLLSDIFYGKDRSFLLYSLRLITYIPDMAREEWDPNEIVLYGRIMQREIQKGTFNRDRIKWKSLAEELFRESGFKYFRTPHQCSQKYVNHINSALNKKGWAIQEDLALIQLIEVHGLKWAKITRLLQTNRTQHMVKNRYHSILRSCKKKPSEYLSYEKSQKYLSQYKCRMQNELEARANTEPSSFEQLQSNTILDRYDMKSQIKEQIIEEPLAKSCSQNCSIKTVDSGHSQILALYGTECKLIQTTDDSIDSPQTKVSWLERLWSCSRQTIFNEEWLEPRERIIDLEWIEEGL